MDRSVRRFLFTCVAASCLAASAASTAGEFAGITEQEAALLPRWCAHTHPFASEEAKRLLDYYRRSYGSDFMHVHHTCWGLVELMRAYNGRLAAHHRRHFAGAAVKDFAYVLKSTREGFPLRMDTLRAMAQAQQWLGDLDNAERAARQIIKEFPDAPEGYIATAIVLIGANRHDAAAKLLDDARSSVSDPGRIESARSALLRNR